MYAVRNLFRRSFFFASAALVVACVPIVAPEPVAAPLQGNAPGVTLTSRPAEEPTNTTVPTTAATIAPQPAAPTAPPLDATPIADTLVLYTAGVSIQTSPDRPASTYWAFRTLPLLPQLDPAVFDTLYGPRDSLSDFSMLFADRPVQLSPDGSALLVPGLSSFPEYNVEGTGTWVVDVATGAARQLLPDGVSATWHPAGDAIAYADGGTLYTLDIAEDATPQAIFQHPDLWNLYARWSPDGSWIAAVSGAQHEPAGEAQTNLTFTYWLVPAGGGPARELAQRETYGAGYQAGEVSWSPDGQYLLMHNQVYDLAGNALLPEPIGGARWMPDGAQLLVNGETLSVVSVNGEQIAHFENSPFANVPAFSRDGRRLAHSMPRTDQGIPLVITDLESGETQVIGVVPDAFYATGLRWSADDARLIVGADHGEGRYAIWTLPARPNATAEQLLADAVLIEAVPFGR